MFLPTMFIHFLRTLEPRLLVLCLLPGAPARAQGRFPRVKRICYLSTVFPGYSGLHLLGPPPGARRPRVQAR